jgi:hypothetical protein
MTRKTLTLDKIHKEAGVPEGAEIVSYDWTENGLSIEYYD